ncbi:jg23785 [Pararge aegeria aegeria]|uniref:Jg23785 protein n=1 Tax=Pararge aegeria aegeria TaxID=348720 RepID=A0A8S4SHN3_9NEOP|nr:jg23785 [Pararge aegeria aegeria]
MRKHQETQYYFIPICHLLKIKSEYHYTYEDDMNSMPIITLEVLTDSSSNYPSGTYRDDSSQNTMEAQEAGVHFLQRQPNHDDSTENKDEDNSKEPPKAKNEFLEYMLRNDGSVICRLCGEILQSRTHWYRHKYKLHVVHPLNPTPLFQCEQCLVYFKSRKGYIGHLSSRHSEVLSDSSPVLTNSQAEALSKQCSTTQTEIKEEPDPELVIPKTSVPNYQNNGKHTNIVTKSTENRKVSKSTSTKGAYDHNKSDWDEKREREEKLVADIIDRVRRECEAQGSGGATRKGYTRRTTVMHT